MKTTLTASRFTEDLSKDPFTDMDLTSRLLPTASITSFEDWRIFVAKRPPEKPTLDTFEQYNLLSKNEKKAFNTERKKYHAQFGPIETPQLEDFHNDVLKLAALNYQSPPGARHGVMLDGLGTVGKSTIALHLGRKYELFLRKRLNIPTELPNGNLFIPVVYIGCSANISVKDFNKMVVSYLNVPSTKRDTESDLTEKIIRAAKACGVSMFIVDDIHFVNINSRSATGINDHFKKLASDISATFLYAGINIQGTKLISEGNTKEREHFSQTAGRFKRYEIRQFEKDSEELKSVLATFEYHLLLLKQPKNSLSVQMADYIFDRTNGFLGSISLLLREAANLAIDDGSERLTLSIFNKVTLPHSAEQFSSVSLGNRRKRG